MLIAAYDVLAVRSIQWVAHGATYNVPKLRTVFCFHHMSSAEDAVVPQVSGCVVQT